MPLEQIVFRLALALFLGVLVGLERQLRQNTAGLRMNTLVAIGAASFVLFGNSIAADGIGTGDSLARIASQIVTGIGFLGGGVIMREGASIKGIATAATLWCSAAIGMFAGVGLFNEAIICTVFVVATNLLLRPLAWMIKKHIDLPHLAPDVEHTHSSHGYQLNIRCHNEAQEHIRALLLQEIRDGELQLKKLESTSADGAGSVEIGVTVTSPSARDVIVERVIGRVSLQNQVSSASWQPATA